MSVSLQAQKPFSGYRSSPVFHEIKRVQNIYEQFEKHLKEQGAEPPQEHILYRCYKISPKQYIEFIQNNYPTILKGSRGEILTSNITSA